MSSSGTLVAKFNFAPGIHKNSTELDSEGSYVSCDKFRFFYGKPEKIGGWQTENFTGEIKGVTRALHTWVDLEEELYLGFGTHKELGILNGGEYHDITPVVASASGDNVLNTSAGSTEVLVSLNPQGAEAGDYFFFTCVTASAGNGLQIAQSSVYEIASVGASYFIFNTSTTAVATSTAAGGTAVVQFLLPTGRQSNGAAFGWGAGTWNTPGSSASAGWGEPRGVGTDLDLTLWSLDNWGEDLVASRNGEKIYYWQASAGPSQRAVLMSSAAPSIANTMVVAQNGRHVIVGGTHTIAGDYDPMLVRWSDSEDFNTWVASATNQAGSFRLENGSFIIGLKETRSQILVFTDESLYEMNRVGGNSVFSFRDLGKHNGLMSQNAAVDVNGIVFWMGYGSFQNWDGNLHTLPCSLQEDIFNPNSDNSINYTQKDKVYCATNREFNEIWWFYPSKNSTENNRYVVYNYLENTWYSGTMDRTAWHDVDIFTRPYATDPNGNLFIHEQGSNADASAMKCFLQTSFFDLDDGDKMMFVDRYIPDNTINKDLNVVFNYKKYPQASEEFTKGPFAITPSTRKVHPRIRGRQMQITYSTSTLGATVRLGSDRLAIKPDGDR